MGQQTETLLGGFPPEIWIEVAKNVEHNSGRDLRNLRLVNSQFRHLVSPIVFREFTLHLNYYSDDIPRIQEELVPKYTLRQGKLQPLGGNFKFTQKLTLTNWTSDDADGNTHRGIFKFSFNTLPKLLHEMPNLKKLHVYFNMYGLSGEEIVEFFSAACAKHTSVSVSLDLNYFNSESRQALGFESVVGLRRLTLSDRYGSLGSEGFLKAIAGAIVRSPLLEHLDLGDYNTDLDTLLSFLPKDFMFKKLKTLILVNVKPPSVPENIAKIATKSLRQIDTRCGGRMEDGMNELTELMTPDAAEDMWCGLRERDIPLEEINVFDMVDSELFRYLSSRKVFNPSNGLKALTIRLCKAHHLAKETLQSLAETFWEDVLPFIIPELESLTVAFRHFTSERYGSGPGIVTEWESNEIKSWSLEMMTPQLDKLHPRKLKYIEMMTGAGNEDSISAESLVTLFTQLANENKRPFEASVHVIHFNASSFHEDSLRSEEDMATAVSQHNCRQGSSRQTLELTTKPKCTCSDRDESDEVNELSKETFHNRTYTLY